MVATGVLDDGTRTKLATGSLRENRTGKGRFDLITPYGLTRLALHYENGARKYGERNWELGQPVHFYLDSALRHLFKYLAGMRHEDHLAAAAWNVLAAIHTEEMVARGELPGDLYDVPGPRPRVMVWPELAPSDSDGKAHSHDARPISSA